MDLKNKKGDVTISTIILIVLGLAVLVLVIIGFTKGWGFLFGIFDVTPSNLQQLSLACEGAASVGYNDFCRYRLMDISGKDELVNCLHPLIISELKIKGVDIGNDHPARAFCNDQDDLQIKAACDEIGVSKRDGTRINNGEDGTCKTPIFS